MAILELSGNTDAEAMFAISKSGLLQVLPNNVGNPRRDRSLAFLNLNGYWLVGFVLVKDPTYDVVAVCRLENPAKWRGFSWQISRKRNEQAPITRVSTASLSREPRIVRIHDSS